MKRIFGWARSNGKAKVAEIQRELLVTPEHVDEFLRYFPLGTRLQYYPEYEKKIQLNTVILAYCLNGISVYTDEAIRFSHVEGNPELLLTTESGRRHVSKVDSFHFIIPKSSRTLIDYEAAAATASGTTVTQRTVNDFRLGNTVTLLNKGTKGCVWGLDTTVARVTVLPGGYYANRHVAYLQPFPETLAAHSTRTFVRIYTNIAATLAEAPEAEAHGCTILDFSERFLRVGLAASDCYTASLSKGKTAYITVALPKQSRIFLLRAAVFRRQGDQAVLSLTGVFKNHRFENLDLIDELELKGGFLQHPASQQPCSSKNLS